MTLTDIWAWVIHEPTSLLKPTDDQYLALTFLLIVLLVLKRAQRVVATEHGRSVLGRELEGGVAGGVGATLVVVKVAPWSQPWPR